MPARRRPPGVRLGLDRRSGPVGSAFLVDVADDILTIDCDSADRVEVVQEIATELQGHGYRPFGLLPVGPVTNICSSPSFVERQAGLEPRSELHGRIPSLPTRAKSWHVTEQDDLGSCHDESHGMSHRHHSDRAATLKFNRSSQHRTERGCDDDTKKAFGTGRTSETTLARPALGSAAREATPVLGGNCDRTLE